jgi:hypothetical protein
VEFARKARVPVAAREAAFEAQLDGAFNDEASALAWAEARLARRDTQL